MYEQFTAQFESSLKPLTTLMEINRKAIESVAQQQATLFNSSLSDSLAFTQDLAQQKDFMSMLKIQKEYSEDFSDKLITASKDLYDVMVKTQEEKMAIYKDAFSTMQDVMTNVTAPIQAAPKRKKAKTSAS